MDKEIAKNKILELVKDYCEKYHNNQKEFTEGDRINYAGRIYDGAEMVNLVDSSLEFWLTNGRYTQEFEKKLAAFLGAGFCGLVNSGSSANLLAFMALTSPLLYERAIKRGDEVITVAAGFPTTVAPIIQYGAVPVFVDISIPQYNIDVNKLNAALSKKTKAVMLAHTLGNPFDLKYIKDFCFKNDLWLIEDNCDALGSVVNLDGKDYYTGTVGDIGTSSFYPPHHMTMGEGGAVYTNNPLLNKIIISMRDWGRDCVCPSGVDNYCGHRFEKKFGELPKGYDHKYVYSHFGYNLKATDLQAAIGVAQLDKLPGFIKARRENFEHLRNGLKDIEEIILPEKLANSKPSWFGFMITVKDNKKGVTRDMLVKTLEEKNIQTRNLFAGNLVRHPCFDGIRGNGNVYKISGNLDNTDKVMQNSFWIGVYPGMNGQKLDYMIKTIKGAFCG